MGLNFAQSFLKAFRFDYSISCGGFIVARSDEMMYTAIIMKFLRKIATGSLVIVLASFAGSFCIHPVQAQTTVIGGGNSMDMSSSEMGQDREDGDTVRIKDTATSAFSTCLLNCVTEAPQATATKKTSIDTALNISAVISQTEQLRSFELFPNPLDMTGVHPPSPDILSSVVKIE